MKRQVILGNIGSKISWIVALLAAVLLLNACGVAHTESTLVPKETASPVVKAEPTTTSNPILTEAPTAIATKTPTITQTSTPSFTPTITDTPSPTPFGGSGKLIFTDRESHQYLFDFGSMQAEFIYKGYGLLSASPDGSLVALISNPHQHYYASSYNDYSLFITKINEGEPLLISSSYCENEYWWSADSKLIAFDECYPEEKRSSRKLYDIETQRTVNFEDTFAYENSWDNYEVTVTGTQLGEISGPNMKMDLSDLPLSIPEALPWPGKVSGIFVHYYRFPDNQRVLIFLEFYHSVTENTGSPNEREVINYLWQNGKFYVVTNEGKLLREFSLNELLPAWESSPWRFFYADHPISQDSQWFVAGRIENYRVVFWLVNLTTGETQKFSTTAIMGSDFGPFIGWLPSNPSDSSENQSKTATPTPFTVDLHK